MAGCRYDSWTLQDLASALQGMHKDNKRIVVPMFQRGKRWTSDQERAFVDSLIKGYPVGTMLFYETIENNQRTYILVDGLQRGNSIKKYMNNPTEFFYDSSISDDICQKISKELNKQGKEHFTQIRTILSSFIKNQKTFKNIQYYSVAKEIVEAFGADSAAIGSIIDIISLFFDQRQDLYDKIANTTIPIIVYTGDEGNLPDIFDRINSRGTPLDKYEVYAAAWPANDKKKISNVKIVDYVVRKYDSFITDGYAIHGYSKEKMLNNRELNAFEYLFGLSKYLVEKYEILGFGKNIPDDTVNPIAFELVNACLNDSDKIKVLYKNLHNINFDDLEKALCAAIDFVNSAVSMITKFKGNKHNKNNNARIFHSKYQILSMISTTFKEMYSKGDLVKVSDTWLEHKTVIAKNLVQYYIYDIITDYWSEGGTGKIHAAAKPNRYMNPIPSRAWMIALDSFFEKSMQRTELKRPQAPKSEELVILNCVYLKTFTAMDQLSIDRFDVEHIAPKEQMRKLISGCHGDGLPISCIANLCYLPEYVNRSKRDNNFYQDKKYLSKVKLEEVETKYSFTDAEDLEWMDADYEKPGDFQVLKEYYVDFCTKRFDEIKHKFCESMGIKYEIVDEEYSKKEQNVIKPSQEKPKKADNKFADQCAFRVAQQLSEELVRVRRNIYKTANDSKGFVISTSKAYKQGNRDKYWFAYRRKQISELDGCQNKYVVYGCKDENTVVLIPVEEIEKRLDQLNVSSDEDGTPLHWHIVLFKDINGDMTWLLSKPTSEEIDVNKYVI